VAHVTGFTNVEDRGQEGVELAWESVLAARTGSRRVIKDRLGNVVEEDWLLARPTATTSGCRSTAASSSSPSAR